MGSPSPRGQKGRNSADQTDQTARVQAALRERTYEDDSVIPSGEFCGSRPASGDGAEQSLLRGCSIYRAQRSSRPPRRTGRPTGLAAAHCQVKPADKSFLSHSRRICRFEYGRRHFEHFVYNSRVAYHPYLINTRRLIFPVIMAESNVAVIKVVGADKTYKFGEIELSNKVFARNMVRQILHAAGAPSGPPSDIELNLKCEVNPAEDIEFNAAELLTMVETCVTHGKFSTAVGRVVLLSLASEAPRKAATTTASRADKGFTSHWKICLRWCPALRKNLLRLPEAERSAVVIAECASEEADSQFILLKHVSAMRKLSQRVCSQCMQQLLCVPAWKVTIAA